jgi:hypothetical protein
MTDQRMNEEWRTREELDAARDRFEQAIPGWRRPAAWGSGRLNGAGADSVGSVEFVHVNVAYGFLPAVVLGTVCGRVDGSGSYPLTVDELDRAIALLAPAAAATMMEHPNLAALRTLRAESDVDHHAIVVFIGDLNDETDDPAIRALHTRLSLDQG